MIKNKEHLFPYEWEIKTTKFTKDKGTVFSCFACGGGSSFGYKLAGFDVLGCNEIDPKMAECYKENHKPKFAFIEPIQTFKLRDDLPEDLYNLDILDGSPPCSSFSMAGNREKDWGKEKKFREGQQEQVLDTLFFDFIDLAKKLQPKVVIAENVKGLLQGSAKKYLSKIGEAFEAAGYDLGYKLLDASKMGVPQKRERVFFYAIRKDLSEKIEKVDLFGNEPWLDLGFDEERINYSTIKTGLNDNPLPKGMISFFDKRIKKETCMGETKERLTGKRGYFSHMFQSDNKPLYTITSNSADGSCVEPGRWLNVEEVIRGGSYPADYNFLGNRPKYLIGMSVPPVMMAQIATRIYEQWLSKI